MINRRYLNFKTYDAFLRLLNADEIRLDSIVFIQDKACIWAHGKEYICDGPDSTNVAGNAITFKNGKDEIIFTISLDNGTIEFTDSLGNTSSATYILKDDFDELNRSRVQFLQDIVDTISKQPMRTELKDVAYSGLYSDLTGIPTIPVTDISLSNSSVNPVQNKAIKEALDLKADISTLGGYVPVEQYTNDLREKQDLLTAGYGISIDDNVVSSTLDTSVYLIVTELPSPLNADPNKIYLLESLNTNETFRYEQYRLRNGSWVSFDAVMPSVDLTPYLTKAAAANTYLPKGSYLTSVDLVSYAKLTDLAAILQLFNGYATYDYVDTTFQPAGDYVTQDYVNNTFVKRTDVYTPKQDIWGTDSESDEGSGGLPIIIQQGSTVEVDNALSLTSSNPVENRIITRALNNKLEHSDIQGFITSSDIANKVDSSTLNNYVTNNTFLQAIGSKQDTLTPGDGISIVNNVISSTVDTNMWVIVDELPSTNINDNKIYLVEEEDNGDVIYVEWRHKNGEWVRSGQRTPEIDLSGYQRVGDYATNDQVALTYLSKSDAANTYQPIGNYVDATDVANTYQEKGDYVEYDTLEAFRINIDSTFLKKGGYALSSDVTNALTLLQLIIDQKYVLKTDVPMDNVYNTSDPVQILLGHEQGGQSTTIGVSRMVTLTTNLYEILVQNNAVQSDTYYFTYEGEAETDLWHFGDTFPIILTDLSTPDNIGTFPINLT